MRIQSVGRRADVALYAAKRSGRNGWVGFEPSTQATPASAQAVVADPPAAVSGAGMRVAAAPGLARPLRWS